MIPGFNFFPNLGSLVEKLSLFALEDENNGGEVPVSEQWQNFFSILIDFDVNDDDVDVEVDIVSSVEKKFFTFYDETMAHQVWRKRQQRRTSTSD